MKGMDEIPNDELVRSVRVFKHGFGEFLRLSEGSKLQLKT